MLINYFLGGAKLSDSVPTIEELMESFNNTNSTGTLSKSVEIPFCCSDIEKAIASIEPDPYIYAVVVGQDADKRIKNEVLEDIIKIGLDSLSEPCMHVPSYGIRYFCVRSKNRLMCKILKVKDDLSEMSLLKQLHTELKDTDLSDFNKVYSFFKEEVISREKRR